MSVTGLLQVTLENPVIWLPLFLGGMVATKHRIPATAGVAEWTDLFPDVSVLAPALGEVRVGTALAGVVDTHVWQLAWVLDHFLDWRGHWRELAATKQAALAAAGRLADPTAQARAHGLLARALIRLGRLDDARTQLLDALDLSTQVGNLAEQAHTHHTLAYVWERQRHPADALIHCRRALELFEAAGHQDGQADALNGIGWMYTLLGDHQLTLTYCQHALPPVRKIGDQGGQGGTWDSLGYIHHHLGQYPQAIDCYQHAIELFRTLGDRYYEATTLTRLGNTHHANGDPAAARDTWQRALSILTDLDHPDADRVHIQLTALDGT